MKAQTKAKGATKAKGFGPAKAKEAKRRPIVQLDPGVAAAMAELEQGAATLETYLNPAYLEEDLLANMRSRLRGGDVVVLRDAFRPEFAEMVYSELMDKGVSWELNEAYFPDGYAYKHHNVYDQGSFSARLNATLGVFTDPASQAFMADLTGRDCDGVTTGAPSWYQEGEHSLPHTDWAGQRTVAYVWHLSKNWKPEWGGALYWAEHHHAVATYPASFNTLVLFSVTPSSAHFVTTVSPHHKGKRLTFNGWWQSAWEPSAEHLDEIERALSDDAARKGLTHTQIQAITDLITDPWQNLPAEQKERISALRKQWMEEFFPSGDARVGSA
jgi:hypothetical protein